MDREQTKTVIRKIKTIYQNKFVIDDPRELVDEWYMFLKDYDFNNIADNLVNHVKTNKFPPTIADLIKEPEKRNGPSIPSVNDTMSLLDKMRQWEKEARR